MPAPGMPYIGHWSKEKMLAMLCEVTKEIVSLKKQQSDDNIVKQLEYKENLKKYLVFSLKVHHKTPVGKVTMS